MGVVDWDCVCTVLICLGNERFLYLITRDWDPVMYAYSPAPNPNDAKNLDSEMQGNRHRFENSPAELKRYINAYGNFG